MLVLAILSKWYFTPSKSRKNLSTSPSKLSIIGNLHQLGSSPHRSLHALAKKHVPLMLLHFSRVPVVVASSADASREIMKTHDLHSCSPTSESQKSSIVSSNERRRNGFDHREDQTNQLPSFPVVDLSMLLMSLTNGVICRAALGRKHDGEKFKELFSSENYCRFDAFLEGVIEEHVERNIQTSSGDDDENKDFVDILLDIQNQKDANFVLDRDTVKALILDVFTGGTDSTYTTLEWEFNQNAVLKAVVKETFRMHTPLPLLVPRESTHDVKVLGYDIAADAWAVEQDPCLRDHPEEFRPERFLDSPVDYKGLHFELTPFGVGRRKCPHWTSILHGM
ncbi:cytochrome P450 71A2-like protein [Tanacetum coccineum]